MMKDKITYRDLKPIENRPSTTSPMRQRSSPWALCCLIMMGRVALNLGKTPCRTENQTKDIKQAVRKNSNPATPPPHATWTDRGSQVVAKYRVAAGNELSMGLA